MLRARLSLAPSCVALTSRIRGAFVEHTQRSVANIEQQLFRANDYPADVSRYFSPNSIISFFGD
jgi:hypothetical protein